MKSHNVFVCLGMFCAGLVYSTTAAAGQCDEDYSSKDVMADLNTAKDALKEGDSAAFIRLGKKIEQNLLCLDAALVGNAPVFDKLYRYIGYGYYYADNRTEAEKWFRSAQESYPTFRFSADALEEKNLQEFVLRVKADNPLERTELEGMSLNIPAGTKLYLNGILTTKAAFSKDQHNFAYLVSGTDSNVQIQARFAFEDEFPAEILSTGKEEDVYDASIKKVDRVRPPEKTPLMIAGGVSALVAAGLYGYTFKTNQDFEAATNPDDLRTIQSLNNNLIITAGIVGVVGFGIGYTGVLIDDKGGIRF